MTTLTAGSKAPVFRGLDQNGDPISLADYKGRKVVLYFYPKDDTPTCTVQACNLRDNQSLLLENGIEVIGVSIDPVKKHKKFETKYGLPFRLVSDEDHKIAEQYGVWGEKKFMGRVFDGTHRTTFLIDEKGKIRKILAKPDSKNHSQQVLDAWNEMNKRQ